MRRADAPIAYGHAQKPEYVPVALRASVFIESRRFRAAVRKRPVALESGGIGRKREKNTEKRGADERFEQRVFLPALPGRLRVAISLAMTRQTRFPDACGRRKTPYSSCPPKEPLFKALSICTVVVFSSSRTISRIAAFCLALTVAPVSCSASSSICAPESL